MKIIRKFLLFLCIVLLELQFPVSVKSEAESDISGISAASDTSDYKILGSIGGPTNAAAVSGNYVYVGKGTSVIVLENAGGRLTQVGQQLNLPSYLSDLKVQGKTLYAAQPDGRCAYVLTTNLVYVINIENPLSPTLVETVTSNSGGPARGVTIDGKRMYVADEWGDKVYSLDNPAKPALIRWAYR
jgi:hypothetical protein